MDVSKEQPDETNRRLSMVFARAEIVWYEGHYAFEPVDADIDSLTLSGEILALIKLDDAWSVLRKTEQADELCALFRVRFPVREDNSGFVGWLANVIKRECGSGVGVVCGYDSAIGDLFDYYAVPASAAADVRDLLGRLKSNADAE